ncbi:hypothetical protein NUW58_g5235 [Xylaria curta]|uniref:Uncharacterized protein n=1 Tax=Xylaria curta TaxID=42375 RepID=A0ACC1P336_9PEZI|nr:hypothetical protein NUW58_g5235 [Xylaria curta]
MAGEETNGAEPVKQDVATQASRLQHLSLAAQTIHADDYLNAHNGVAPPMHVSTTFRYSRNPDDLSYMNNGSAGPSDLLFCASNKLSVQQKLGAMANEIDPSSQRMHTTCTYTHESARPTRSASRPS